MNSCQCGVNAIEYTSRKEGPNKGRKFWTCKERKCKYFEWSDGNNYNPGRFKNGACYRCGRYGCDAVDCDETTDWFGNQIPDNWGDYI